MKQFENTPAEYAKNLLQGMLQGFGYRFNDADAALRYFIELTKSEVESLLSSFCLITLNDQEAERLKRVAETLIQENLDEWKKQCGDALAQNQIDRSDAQQFLIERLTIAKEQLNRPRTSQKR